MHLDDTIVAIATPPGRGGIGVVRLAGSQAKEISAPFLKLRHALRPNHAVFAELIDPETGERIDEIVVTYFAKPRSYTTDDIVEISVHGSPVVLRYIIEKAIERGARLAQPGEFTMRAFVHGRLDLAQAEAVRDLIESQTLYQAKIAAQQLRGALSGRLRPIKKILVDLIALLEAGIDFAEDDVAVLPAEQVLLRLEEIRVPLKKLSESFTYGKVVHEGMTLAIIGRPNVGKSSLFNRLVERECAIVTALPGTTRDLVTETISLDGVPVKLVDTAGIRAAHDDAESIGVKKSYEALADADIVLLVVDASQAENREDAELKRSLEHRRHLLVLNKSDLDGSTPADSGIRTSAKTGEGIPELKGEILKHVGGEAGTQGEAGFLTNIRHQALVNEALLGLAAAESAVQNHIPHEMVLMDLYNALRPLDAITGETTADDILHLIFSSFCIGK